MTEQLEVEKMTDLPLTAQEIIEDYRLAYKSRQASIVGRREVMSGKAKFGIFGDGKEVPQVALAKAFKKGDFRSGYYRDQTLIFALGMGDIQAFFAQLYAHADQEAEPFSAGRQMNAHFATRSLNPNGRWRHLTKMNNSSADVSPTGSQMPRLVGLAYASKLYRELEELKDYPQFSHNGNEIAFGTIGNATCAEGMFWESINAVGVLKAPMILAIWDDEYGISVPNEYQITKENISELLKGFQRDPGARHGYDIYSVKGWEYPTLVETFLKAAEIAREEHVPSIIHVVEINQPQGHSTSGSHERYKSEERLQWEEDIDGIRRMRSWLIEKGIASEGEIEAWEQEDRKEVESLRKKAWDAFQKQIKEARNEVADIIDEIAVNSTHADEIAEIKQELLNKPNPIHQDVMKAVHKTLFTLRDEALPTKAVLIDWKRQYNEKNIRKYSKYVYGESPESALRVPKVKPVYSEDSPTLYGYEILNHCFDAILERDPRVIAFGEDVGYLGGVNQAFAGLQEKYGELRVSDTGIRETTIIGQAIGMAMRGLRPIAEIQYIDYLLYALQILSDDLATVHWRSAGGQKAPVIVRTRGHRLEGIWHSGSPMAAIIHLLRGVHVLVPRNMTQAAGFYNTLLLSEEPGLVVEVLNGYRMKERLPDNMDEFTIPLGVPEILREGTDVTVVTYGALCRSALNAAERLSEVGIEVELIDVQSLLPFDIHGKIFASLKKTNRVLFLDEDMPGGTTAYMMEEVIEKQGGFFWLDSKPRTLAARPHRPAYGSDGNYWSKPNTEQIFETVYEMMNEVEPDRYPIFF